MVHDKAHKVVYNDFMLLDDNFDDEVFKGFSYIGSPVKLMFLSLIICVKGKMRVRVNLKDMNIGPNDVLLINPGAIIDMVVCEGECRMTVIHIDVDKVGHKPSVKIMLQLRSIINNESVITHLSDNALSQFLDSYKSLRRVISDEGMRFKDEVIIGSFQSLAAYWMNEIAVENEMHKNVALSRNEQLFQGFIREVQKNYMVNREVSFYASKLCITPKYLGVVVAQVSGRRPLEWIRDYVILDAKAMLLSREYSIQQISQILHFPNPSFFSKYFREAVGCSPSKFLNNEGA